MNDKMTITTLIFAAHSSDSLDGLDDLCSYMSKC